MKSSTLALTGVAPPDWEPEQEGLPVDETHGLAPPPPEPEQEGLPGAEIDEWLHLFADLRTLAPRPPPGPPPPGLLLTAPPALPDDPSDLEQHFFIFWGSFWAPRAHRPHGTK